MYGKKGNDKQISIDENSPKLFMTFAHKTDKHRTFCAYIVGRNKKVVLMEHTLGVIIPKDKFTNVWSLRPSYKLTVEEIQKKTQIQNCNPMWEFPPMEL